MNSQDVDKLANSLDKIGKLFWVVHTNKLSDMKPADQAEQLNRCGFSNAEVAGLLGMTQNAVNVALHRRKKKSSSSRKSHK